MGRCVSRSPLDAGAAHPGAGRPFALTDARSILDFGHCSPDRDYRAVELTALCEVVSAQAAVSAERTSTVDTAVLGLASRRAESSQAAPYQHTVRQRSDRDVAASAVGREEVARSARNQASGIDGATRTSSSAPTAGNSPARPEPTRPDTAAGATIYSAPGYESDSEAADTATQSQGCFWRTDVGGLDH